ncbi:putative MFS family arabinose efflux permease [Curtobacterium sp. PhB130]|uniref:MFS transporter n=1 Tax=unclassified Curtobacterium TaxID=257496 RepID=UPI000F4CE7F7|nr:MULTISPECIES: MFS transporter [unclassified Curtobacterium]ROS74649.1 putative MFS family arabinose efflux permease [Curtobacterium sp. PhB130]TCK59272.1 putative MFS family arabinose efflux permease [Curtobacterium sp. PhB136]
MQQPGTAPPQRVWTAGFACLFASYALISLGLTMSNVLIGKYTDSLGATPSVIGIVSSAFAVTAIVFKCVSAPAIDSFDRKYVLMGAAGAIAIAMFGYGLSDSVPPLIVFRLVQGAGQAFTATCCIAFAADLLPRERLGIGIGVFSLAPALAQVIGPNISLGVSAAFGYRTLFLVAGGVLLVAAALVTRVRAPSVPRRPFRITPRNVFAPEVAIPALLFFLLVGSYSLVNPFLALFAERQGAGAHIALFFTVDALTLFVSRPLAGRLADRFGYGVLAVFFGLFAASLLVISTAHTLPVFLLAAVLLGFGYGSCQPLIEGMAMKMVPADRRGAASCTTFLGSDAGDFAGPIAGGAIAQSAGYPAMWQTMTLPLVAGAVLAVVLRRPVARRLARAARSEADVVAQPAERESTV